MVLCVVALVVLGFLSLFSAKYRPLAKEALHCVGRMATLRPCESNFEMRMKSQITTRLMAVSPAVGGFTYKHFSVLSWAFTGSFFVSLGYTAYSVYNLFAFGNCAPGTPASACPFNPNTTWATRLYDLVGSWEAIVVYIVIAVLAFLMVESGRGASTEPKDEDEEEEE